MRTRRKPIALFALLGVLGACAEAPGQNAGARARQDLAEAVKQHEELTNQIAEEEAALIEEVERLDDRVLALGKELRTLEGEEALATKKKAQLKLELEKRQVEFDYLLRTLNQYGRQAVNRLHVAESQIYEDRIEAVEREVEAAGENLVGQVEASVPLLQLGVNRLLEVAGGSSFEGKAAGPGNTLETGKFAIFGPIGFFASDSGEVAGMTSFTAGDVNIPAILQMDADQRKLVSALVKDGKGVAPVDASLGKAFQLEEGKKNVREFLAAGGPVGYAILGLGILAGLLALFKLIEILSFKVPARGDVNVILDELLEGEEEAATERAASLPGLAGRVVEAGARHFYSKRRIMEYALFERMSAVQPRLDRFLPFLAVIAAAAPMAGLLGTVLGIMKTFDMMAQFGTGDAKVTAGGIGEALITTFLGLMVAIPTIIGHGILKSLARTRLGQVEGIALALINGTTEIVKPPEPESTPSEDDADDSDDVLEDLTIEPA